MTRWSMLSLLAVCLLIPCCQSQPPADNNSDEFPEPEPPPLFEADAMPFAIVVSADRGIGVPGTSFNLHAEVAGGTSNPVAFSWTVNEGEPVSTDQSPELTFDEPGDYLVDVTIQNDAGATATDGILLRIFEPDQTTSTTSQISPAEGMPSTFVQVWSPALDDPEILVQVMVGNSEPFEPFRPELGTANFLIPLAAAGDMTAASVIQIQLLANGQEQDSFDFMISPAADLSEAPGTIIKSWLQSSPDMIAAAEDSLVTFLGGIDAGLTPDEEALMRAFLRFAEARFEQVRDTLIPIVDGLDDSTRTLIDQALIANGVTTADLIDLTLQSKDLHAAKNSNDGLIDDLCRFHDLVDAVKAAVAGLESVAQLLNVVGVAAAGTPAGLPTVLAADVIAEMSQALKSLTILADIVPRVLDDLVVTADPSTLQLDSDKAVIMVKAQLTKADLCQRASTANDLARYLTDEFAKFLADRLVNLIVSRSFARDYYRHLFRTGQRVDPAAAVEAIEQFKRFLTGVVANIVKINQDILVLDNLLKPIIDKMCAVRDRDTLELQPEEAILTQRPGGSGRFLNLQENSIDFYCNVHAQGSVTINAERPCGIDRFRGAGPRSLTGEATITCGVEPCTEDASGSISVTVIPGETQLRESSCGFITENLERRNAAIVVTNTHASRDIWVAAVSFRVSDQQDIPRACQDLGNFSTLQDCIDHLVAGCDSSVGGRLGPGESSVEAFGQFICRDEFIFPGSGLCGDMELETQTTHWIVQAVFCDNFENAQKNFCPQMDLTMKTFGQQSANWGHKEVSGCP